MFCGGHDVLPDGRAFVCTLHGDVWLVDGIDDTLETDQMAAVRDGSVSATGRET